MSVLLILVLISIMINNLILTNKSLKILLKCGLIIKHYNDNCSSHKKKGVSEKANICIELL